MFKEEDQQKDIKLHDKIGSLEVIAFTTKSKRTIKLRCKCGSEFITYYSYIKRGNVKYCKNKNCSYREENNYSREKRLYNLYKYVKNICYNENHPQYKEYLFMSDEWRFDYIIFKKWAYLNGYQHNKVMWLKDNSKGYTRDNVEWITRSEYAIRKGANKKYTFTKDNKSLGDLCRERNLNYRAIYQRVFILKWDLDKALNTPIKKNKRSK